MKKAYLWMLLPLVALVACEPTNKPDDPNNGGNQDPDPKPIVIPESFPKKHLIEHFTGEACGYCPYGMECIEEYVKEDTNFIWVSHHTYYEDEFSIKGSNTLANKFGITTAPSMILDRTNQAYVDQSTGKQTSTLVFHPSYLSELQTELEETAYASVSIRSSYDETSRNLGIIVNGLVADTTVNELLLTVLIKENNLIGAQADYYYSWEGWTEFRHNKVVRTFLTAPLGDKVTVEKQQYTDTLAIALNDKWDANNCVIVAYITSADNQPIINAEQVPVVANTTGGEEYKFEGITMVEVPEDYPEVGAPQTNVTFDYLQSEASTLNNGTPYLVLQLLSTSPVTYNGYQEFPFAVIYLVGNSKLTAGTYPLNHTFEANTAISGEKFEDEFIIEGSMLYYVYTDGTYLYPDAQWLLNQGTITVATNGNITIDATTLNGSSFKGTYSASASAPAAKPAQFAAPFRMSHSIMHADMPAVKYNLMRSL